MTKKIKSLLEIILLIPAVARSRLKEKFEFTEREIFVMIYHFIVVTTYWNKIGFINMSNQKKY